MGGWPRGWDPLQVSVETEASQTAHFASVHQAGLTVATVVTMGSGPLLATVGASLTLGESTGSAGTAAVTSGVAGLVLLMGGADGSTGPAPLLGLGDALLSAVGYAGVTLLGRFSGRENAGGAFESTVTGFAVGRVCLLPMALLEGLLPDMEHPAWTLGLILYLGAAPTALAYALFFVGLGVVRATTASVVALAEPLTAAVIGILVFGERFNAIVLTGTALLLSAVPPPPPTRGLVERLPEGRWMLTRASVRRLRACGPGTDAEAPCTRRAMGQWDPPLWPTRGGSRRSGLDGGVRRHSGGLPRMVRLARIGRSGGVAGEVHAAVTIAAPGWDRGC
ncbi:DMT family transporter [Streptomyces sp. NPDC056462]|uniref:DMT family transporter n=1 Tax=Streptomyces sp. NPDC056462 TaxID=3345826 RepID=UPI0036801D65